MLTTAKQKKTKKTKNLKICALNYNGCIQGLSWRSRCPGFDKLILSLVNSLNSLYLT